MQDNEFEKEVVGRLSNIEARLDMLAKGSEKLSSVNETSLTALQYAKAAHHRLDDYKEMAKKEKETSDRELEKYKESIRWTIGVAVTIASVIAGLVEHFI